MTDTSPGEIARLDATLRPCPHCGPMPAKPELVRRETSRHWQVFCGPCGSSSGASRTPQAAADQWNSRHHEGARIPHSSAALTDIAITLANAVEDLTPSARPPVFGFSTPEVRDQAYGLARILVDGINARLSQDKAPKG